MLGERIATLRRPDGNHSRAREIVNPAFAGRFVYLGKLGLPGLGDWDDFVSWRRSR